jgi:NADH dehydrogenase FAD-containing subunit
VSTDAPKRAVLLGAGHAHLYTLKRAAEFRRRGHELVVVAPDAFWYSGLATGVLGGFYPPELDQVDVAALIERGGGRFVRDTAEGVDPAGRTVRLARSGTLRYDALSLTLGSAPPPLPGEAAAASSCYAVKPVRRLWELRRDLEERFRAEPARPVRVVVAGGGITGCEVAANVAALAAARGGRVEVAVVAGGEPMRELPGAARRRVRAALEARGVAFRTGARVARVEPGRALLADGEALPLDLLVNATGLGPAPLVREVGLPVDARGGLLVDERLRSVGDPAVHAAGDCAAFRGRELPKVGVYAIRQAPVLFRNLLAALDGGEPRAFAPQRRYLWIMNLGDGTGLAARGHLWWHGRAAFRLKDAIDRRFLRGYRDPAT